MIYAAVGDTGYNIVLFLHILTALVAFAPAFVHPVLNGQGRTLDPATRLPMYGFIAANGRRIYAPALIVTGLLGFALQGMSDSVWGFDQTWVWLAAVIWVAMNGVLHAVLFPAEKAVAEGDETAQSKLATAGASVTVMLLVVLYLMVFKPGF